MKSPAKTTFETILVIALVVAVLFTPLLADAAHHGSGPPTLEEFDSDGDGFLSQDEFEKGRAARHAEMAKEGRMMKGMASAPSFADFDSDGDGKLSSEEFTAGHAKHMAEMQGKHKGAGKHQHHGKKDHARFEDIDTNGDGCIDKAEMDAHHAEEKAGY
jgi:hypothetical protein